jgi:hypothetical protein
MQGNGRVVGRHVLQPGRQARHIDQSGPADGRQAVRTCGCTSTRDTPLSSSM